MPLDVTCPTCGTVAVVEVTKIEGDQYWWSCPKGDPLKPPCKSSLRICADFNQAAAAAIGNSYVPRRF